MALEARDWINLYRLLNAGRWDMVGAEVEALADLRAKVREQAETAAEKLKDEADPEQAS
jgi:hypothetical protein